MTTVRTLALIAACTFLAAAPSIAAQASSSTAVSNTKATLQLHDAMRKLWTDHVVWTREYIVAAVDGTADADAAAARLMKNQEDIGTAVATYYVKAAGDQLTALLKQHIAIAVDLIKAAKAGDKSAQKQADDRWQQNATDIATFLSNANANWPKEALVAMMKTHLSTTTNEVVARLTKDWNGDVKAYDAVYAHILMMADTLTNGIVKQFPEKFRAS